MPFVCHRANHKSVFVASMFSALFRSQLATPMVVMLCSDLCISLVFASAFGDNLGISVTSLVQGPLLEGRGRPIAGAAKPALVQSAPTQLCFRPIWEAIARAGIRSRVTIES